MTTMTRDEPQGIEVTVSLIDVDVFKRLVRVVADVYAMSDERVKEFIEREMRAVLDEDVVLKG